MITNNGGSAVNLAGWRLNADDAGQDFYFPAYDLAPERVAGSTPAAMTLRPVTSVMATDGHYGLMTASVGTCLMLPAWRSVPIAINGCPNPLYDFY